MDCSGKEQKCSLIMLCGYLGSGKTSLISYILKEQTEYKVAVIQNEFSDEMGIEAPLLQNSKGEAFDKFYELPNGCICCSAKDDFLTAIEYLIQDEKYKLDYILIETNGLADPAASIQNFWVDDDMKYPAELKSIFSIVPSHRFDELKSNDIFMNQLIYADNIILNHADRTTTEELDKIEASLRFINPLSGFKRTSFCKINLTELFETDGFALRKEKLEKFFEKKTEDHESHSHHHPEKSIDSVFIDFNDTAFDAKKLETKIGSLLWENPWEETKFMRIKGIFFSKDDEFIYYIQGVNETFEIKQSAIKWHDSKVKQYSRFLFVGKNMSKEKLRQYLMD